MTLLTADDVLNKKFQATKFREGYEQDEVDEFLDDVVEAMRQLEAENADLKAKLEAANARIASLSAGKTEAPAAAPVAPTPAPAIAEAAPVAAPAAGTGQEPAAAKGMLELAQKLHDEHVSNGKAEGERIITEARTTGESIIREAEDQRNRTLAQLEKERSGLEHKIDELRRFETDYRTRLKSFLSGLLNTVDGGGTSTDGVNL
ncbi:cell division protein GpsB [Actinomyces bovis]|uniref:Cell wall synthesis protein Wag31 n=1 Tax=Actinomyces bovis TaxID=1658 RepID=A0ABY1VP92_9ACTO|nr:DivIVA domain-containing protein [Actinomyces bovis]SPT53939.1 cell division protein GpsB [Actinomyces bovis]VEG53444.1 cell division protein GpsB [Actinomyces israelii]